MNQPLLFSLAIALMAMPFTTYGGEVPFKRFSKTWLHDSSAEAGLATPATYLVRSEDDLRKLPFQPSDIDYATFRSFDFEKRALLFLIHPERTSSSHQIRFERLPVI